MKIRLSLIVIIVLLTAVVCVCGRRSAMKGGWLHHWLVLHNLQKTGYYKGERIIQFNPDGYFMTNRPDWYYLDADGNISKVPGNMLLPSEFTVPLTIQIHLGDGVVVPYTMPTPGGTVHIDGPPENPWADYYPPKDK